MISSVLTYVISNPLGDFTVKDLETEQRVKLSALHAVAVVLLIAQHCQILRIKRSVCPYVHLIISYFYFIEKRIYPKHIKSASVVIVDLKTSNTISLFVLLKKKMCTRYPGTRVLSSPILFQNKQDQLSAGKR